MQNLAVLPTEITLYSNYPFGIHALIMIFFTGPCDRRASHVKSIIRRYINEGHDVTTAQQMKEVQ